MAEKKWVTQSEFSREISVSRQYISRLTKEGLIRRRGRKIDRKGALEFLSKELKKPQKTVQTDDEEMGLSSVARIKLGAIVEHMKRDKISRELLELRKEKEEGRVVNTQEIRGKFFELFRVLRDTLQNLSGRWASVFAAESDVEKIRVVLKREVDRSFEDLKVGVETVLGPKPIEGGVDGKTKE